MYNVSMRKKLMPKPLHHHLQRWLVPHKHNDHRPHLIRIHGLAIVAMLIIGVQVSANLIHPPSVRVLAYATDITPVEIFNQTNQQRVAGGLPPLRLVAKLNQSAALKAQHMFDENYWAHVSPSGIDPWHWFAQAGYAYSYAGENLAKDFDTSAGTVQGWMNSPGHRANIMNVNYTDVGFAVQNGTLLGGQTTLVVAHYGSINGANPAPAAAPVATPVPKKATPKPAATPSDAPAAAPAPTVAPTPETIPTPTPPASPTPTPKATPALLVGGTTPSAPAPRQYSLFKPLSLIRTLNLGTIATIFILFVLLVVYLVTHLTVWRKGLKRWRSTHYRTFAATQIAALTIAIVLLAISGFGQVG